MKKIYSVDVSYMQRVSMFVGADSKEEAEDMASQLVENGTGEYSLDGIDCVTASAGEYPEGQSGVQAAVDTNTEALKELSE